MRMRIAGSLGVLLLLVSLAASQTERGHVAGVVLDAGGRALPGVTVHLTGPETRRELTDSRGEFNFSAVLPGTYQLRCELSGFAAAQQAAVVRAGATARVSVRMAASALSDNVAVSPGVVAASPGVEAPAEVRMKVGGIAGGYAPGPPNYHPGPPTAPFDTEAYDHTDENPFRRVGTDPLSTFSIDVDTASYANVRRFLNSGALPPAGAVRIEELINYFRFNYSQPSSGAPFSITTEVAACPWNSNHQLALIGLQGREMPDENRPSRNLVFLLDVSGSMTSPDKLPLVRTAMRMLTDVLTERDRVAIVVYAGSTGLVLPSTRGGHKSTIHRAIAELEAGGSTNGGAGIQLAYRVARENFIRGGVNRVVLATDGDFNVGVTSQDELIRLIEEQRSSGVFLSVLGVGTGNLKDSTMEKLADKGNGNYSYLDSLHEARKVLVREAGGTLITIAKDVKIQVEFNPKTVAGYRLVGYENRLLRNEEFNDDKKDAGEIGAGHSVTALYEIVPAGVEVPVGTVDPLKYQKPLAVANDAPNDELLTVKIRYKAPDADESRLISTTIRARAQAMPANLGFASAVAEVGMLLRGSKHSPAASYENAISRARTFRQGDPDGYRAEFIKLAELAASLDRMQTTK